MNNKIEAAAFEIISYSGGAKACFLEAVDLSMEYKFEEAEAKMKEGKELLKMTHKAHSELLFEDTNNNIEKLSLLIVHAEDQFMSAESASDMALKFISLNKKLHKLLDIQEK